MWLFLLTEVMFFGGLFTAYLIMRNWYYPAFVDGSHQLSIFWGTANTAVLIVSSFTMAMGVWSRGDAPQGRAGALPEPHASSSGSPSSASRASSSTRNGRSTTFPVSTSAMQSFLNPASDPEVHKQYPDDKPLPPDMAQKTEMYFFLYFAMTGMHALHMVIGIGILVFMIFRARAGAYTTGHVTFVENFGLYWHFVDIIWIYLFRAAVPDQQALLKDTWHERAQRRTTSEHEHHIVSPRIYVVILCALLVGTAATCGRRFDWRVAHRSGHLFWNPVVALAIATTKTTLVVLFFMHVKYSTKLTKLTVASGLFIFLVLIGMTLADYFSARGGGGRKQLSVVSCQ